MVRHHRWRRTGALIVLVAAVLVGCQPDEPDAPAGAVPDAPEPTTEPAEDPYAIPEEIDVAYLERVLEPIEETYGEAIREIKREQAYTDHADELFSSIYRDDVVDDIRSSWQSLQDLSPEFEFITPEPGNPNFSVVEVLDVEEDCAFIAAEIDLSTWNQDISGPILFYLTMTDVLAAPNEFNPTPWLISGEVPADDVEDPESPCA